MQEDPWFMMAHQTCIKQTLRHNEGNFRIGKMLFDEPYLGWRWGQKLAQKDHPKSRKHRHSSPIALTDLSWTGIKVKSPAPRLLSSLSPPAFVWSLPSPDGSQPLNGFLFAPRKTWASSWRGWTQTSWTQGWGVWGKQGVGGPCLDSEESRLSYKCSKRSQRQKEILWIDILSIFNHNPQSVLFQFIFDRPMQVEKRWSKTIYFRFLQTGIW